MFTLRRIKIIIILFITGTLFSVFVSCETEHYLIKDFEFYGVKLINPNETSDEKKVFERVDDTLKNKIFFEIAARGEFQFQSSLKKIGLNDQCYAMSLPTVIDNGILLEELQLKFDSDIYFDSEIIEAGTELWNHPKLKNYRWFYNRHTRSSIYAYIGFTDSFYDKVQIPQKEYTIEIRCKTTDNLTITKSIKLYLEI
jgi:hypothetical protein